MPTYDYSSELSEFHPVVIQYLKDNGFTDIKHEVKSPAGGKIDITAISPLGVQYIIECKWKYSQRNVGQLLAYKVYSPDAILVLALPTDKSAQLEKFQDYADKQGILLWTFDVTKPDSREQDHYSDNFFYALSKSAENIINSALIGEGDIGYNVKSVMLYECALFLNRVLNPEVIDEIMAILELRDFTDNIIYQVAFDKSPKQLADYVGVQSVYDILDNVSVEALNLYNVCMKLSTEYMKSQKQVPSSDLIKRLKIICAHEKENAYREARKKNINLITGKPLSE